MVYDLVVIGAGIQGAGVAQAASAAGFSVLILEQFSEPALGTSSRSSKLIHGGLRYLETGQFSLVKECLVERARLLKNAPHLVKLVPFYIPVYASSKRSRLKIAAGLSLYSIFSLKPFNIVPKKSWGSLNGLQQKGLKSVFKYYDAQTDDALLTKAVLESAQSLGTAIRFNSTFITADIEPEQCRIHYQSNNNRNVHLDCKVIVNATGPWVQTVTQKIPGITNQPDIELVQGTHIEVPVKLGKGILYLEAPQDQRAIFVMPWKGHTLIGTTETLYEGDPSKVEPLESEIEYLLDVYNHYFKTKQLRKDVINAFAGLRVLPKASGSAFNRPRDTLIVGNNHKSPRFWTLYGGKLTAYRATAEQVLSKLSATLATPNPSSVLNTQTMHLK